MRRVLILAGVLAATGCESLVVPSEAVREEFLTWRFGMFIHFNMATFNDREWSNGYEDPKSFAPSDLDPGQWADAAATAGMQYAVLTAKHTGGWSLWDSDLTDHDITAFANYKDGKGDVIQEYVDAFRARGIKVGLYYCFPGDYSGRWGNDLAKDQLPLRGLPREAAGDRVGFIKEQLSELLTRYGQIDLLWIDQARSPYISRGEWRGIRRHIRSVQPGTFVLANEARTYSDTDIHSYEFPLHRDHEPEKGWPAVDNPFVAEVSDVLGPTWFWNDGHSEASLLSAEVIRSRLERANLSRANYLLNVSPDTSGLIPAEAVERLAEVGRMR